MHKRTLDALLRTGLRPRWLALLSCLAAACSQSGESSGVVPSPDFALFQNTVYPVLLRDCAFSTCHGGEHRYFEVWGPGRARLDPNTHLDAIPGDGRPQGAITQQGADAEIRRTYERACSMLANGLHVSDSLLLRKPLEATQGGQGHKGVDSLGRNVYGSVADPDYHAIQAWAESVSTGAGTQGTAGTTGGASP